MMGNDWDYRSTILECYDYNTNLFFFSIKRSEFEEPIVRFNLTKLLWNELQNEDRESIWETKVKEYKLKILEDNREIQLNKLGI